MKLNTHAIAIKLVHMMVCNGLIDQSIPKKNGKLRPLGIPSIDDKLVQEVVRMLLESIYENSFEDTSHGFRPNKSCHTALRMIQNRFTRCKWFVEGDIKGFFDNIDHNVILQVLLLQIVQLL